MKSRQRVLLKDVAAAAGVSAATASVVLNKRKDIQIGEDAKKRVLDAAQKLGYLPKRKAGFYGQPDTICFVFGPGHRDHIGTSFFADTADSLRRLGAGQGVRVTEIRFNPESDGAAAVKQALASSPSLFVSITGEFNRFAAASSLGIPVFALQGDSDPREGETAVYNVDDRAVGRLAAEELNLQEYRNTIVMFPAYTGRSRGSDERLSGFRDSFSGEHTVVTVPDLSPETVEKTLEQHLHSGKGVFDSVYTFSDAMAFGAFRALHKQGVNIPQDVGVIGTDNLYWSAYSWPSLTTMDLNTDSFAMQILTECKNLSGGSDYTPPSGRVIRVPVHLIRRESTDRKSVR